MHHLPQFHVRVHPLIITVYHGVETHQRQHGMVSMVSHQLALARQSHAINAMRFEDNDGQVCSHRNNHQWHEQVIATGNLGYQEDTSQWGMHHTRHHASHTQQGKILLRHIDSYLVDVPQTGKEESCEASDKQRRSKRTTTAATTIGSRCGKHLGQEHESDV